MAKWIRVQVPDHFNPEHYPVSVTTVPPDPLDVSEISDFSKVWQPEYRNVLDYGFVGLVDFMGDDSAIDQAARVSYARGTKRTRDCRGLIRYLMRHRHTTPFEMLEFKFHIKAPIFVFRQWHRHRTFSINEMSARYSILDQEMYLPEHDKAAPQALDNKQGRAGILDEENYKAVVAACEQVYQDTYDTYMYLAGPQPKTDENGEVIRDEDGNPILVQADAPDAIRNRKLFLEDACMAAIRKARQEYIEGEEPVKWTAELVEEKIREWYEANEFGYINREYPGIARELARMVLPVATYSQMYWKGNLKNLLHFIGLRSDPHAQYEIRVYSDAILDLIRPYCPLAIEAFMDYHLHGGTLSRMEVAMVKRFAETLEKQIPDFETWVRETLEESGASKREATEFMKLIE